MRSALNVRSVVWTATVAVLAVFATVLVTQAWTADAAPGDSDSTFVPVAPCRLFDTRPGETPNVGKKTPLAEGEANVYTQQVTGNVGNCVGIPGEATAVAMNVTIVSPTAQSNLRVFPANVATPIVSNLNWLPGQSPTPNKVDVKLSPGGQIKLFNFRGTVDVLADVVGYYTNSTLTEIGQRLTALEAAQPFSFEARDDAEQVADTPEIVVEMGIVAPVAGQVVVNSAASATEGSTNQGVDCSISGQGLPIPELDDDYVQSWTTGGGGNATGQLSGTRVFDVSVGQTLPIELICVHTGPPGGSSALRDIVLTAVFTPAP